MDDVIGGPGAATPAKLTAALTAAGFLPRGAVEEVRHDDAIEGGYSLLWPLRALYSAEAPADAPAALLLKVPRPDIDVEQTAANGRRERCFYRSIAPAAPELPVPRCYSAAIDAAGGRWHLLLENLTASHHDSPGRVPPPEPLCTGAVELLARVHARWWRHPDLDRFRPEIGELLDAERIARVSANASAAVDAFLAFLGSAVTGRHRRTYESLAAAAPELLRRLASGPATLLHGDAHWRNFLYPRDRDRDTTRLFDWQSCTIGPPVHDLAYLLVRHWHAEPRRDLMERLLDAYHAALVDGGVAGYGRARLQEDFRLAALRQAVAPATDWFRWGRSSSRTPDAVAWAARLERSLVPLDVLDCEDVLAAL